jgi:SAM-dependent methyltransferase
VSGGIDRALAGVEALYTDNVAEHGVDSRAVGWPDADSQRLRFEKLAHVIHSDPHNGAFTVADWGCGYGAMFDFLAERFGERLAGYCGYDISTAMLEAARDHVSDPRASFHHSDDVGEDADYVFVSGTFNVRLDADDEAWDAWIKERLHSLFGRARRGLAFNLLTTYVDWRKPDLFYADPAAYFTFCRDELGARVALLHDYPLFEWTIAVRPCLKSSP